MTPKWRIVSDNTVQKRNGVRKLGKIDTNKRKIKQKRKC